MTYGQLKSITTGILIGDNVLPKDEDVMLGLVGMALMAVANRAESLHLMTLDTTDNVLRMANGDYYIRIPNTPEDEVDIMDMEDELLYAVSRYLASYLSKSKGGIHVNEATRIILNFNAKTYDILDTMADREPCDDA